MKQVILFFLSFSLFSTNAQDARRQKHFNHDKSVAVKGYDAVAYFTQNKAIKGKTSFAVIYQGLKFFFASNENKEEFKKNPAKYEPQYGGWCAYAMGESGVKVDFDPETFKIVNGKLYLFYNKAFNNTLKSWNKNEASLKSKADVNWAKFFH